MSSSLISQNNNGSRSQRTSLSVATLEGSEISPNRADRVSLIPNINVPAVTRGNLDDVTKVLSASCLVIRNTVGSSMFVLPEAVGGVGLPWGSVIFSGLYIYNLISRLLLADVAISLHESSECEVPSSFKDFVDTALRSDAVGTFTAGASLLSNSCFLAYGAIAAGPLLVDTFPGLGLDPVVGTCAFAAMISLFAATQTNTGLEKIANAVVMVVFSIPSITKLLDFDRTKTFIALGGGLDSSTASSAGAAAFAAFSASALFVSCLTAVMSLAKDYESIFSSTVENDYDFPLLQFSIPAVAASVIPPVAVALAFSRGGDITAALHFNGAIIVPFLYGLLPIVLHRGVRQVQGQDSAIPSISSVPQVLLGAGTLCALGQEILPNLMG
ncbi:hypothetical protein ACHAW5_008759 [Stephanodiscus triporus]|uniref:Amino acid transporter transmembrane domain-containing protein n=1 Tax=Stephanodiscus triporus TaxID=2934178 RepID=A0ABD3PSY4_9STRA